MKNLEAATWGSNFSYSFYNNSKRNKSQNADYGRVDL